MDASFHRVVSVRSGTGRRPGQSPAATCWCGTRLRVRSRPGRSPAATLLVAACSSLALAGDWTQWRGPLQNGFAPETAIVTTWSPGGENVLWHRDFGGRTTPIVMNGRVFFNGPVGAGVSRQERVICLDADSGKTLWEHRFNVFHTDIVENRVGWTALVGDAETGNIYCHGTGGELFCFSRDGKVLWKHSMSEEFGRISGYGGRLMNPIIDENRVIVSYLNSSWGPMAKPTHRYVAFDKRSGDVLWWAAPGGKPLDTTYATPAVAIIAGRRMLIAPNADGNVYGMLARTGERVWTYKLSKRGLNTSAVVMGNYTYIGHSEENLNNTKMGAIVCIDASKTGDITESGTVWRHDGYPVGYCSPAIANGRVYVISNDADMYAIDGKSGEVYWEYNIGRVGKGSPVVTADGVIYVGEQTGVFQILRDAGDKCIPLHREAFPRVGGHVDELYGSPAVTGGRVYFMTRNNTYCLGNPNATVAPVSLRPRPVETPQPGEQIGTTFLTPADITISPGQRVSFAPSAFTSAGRRGDGPFSSMTPVWTIKGLPGTINQRGEFVAEDANAYSAGTVAVRWVGAAGVARVRIIPRLPIEMTFDDLPAGSIPPGWIGTGGGPNKKIQVVERDGQTVLEKVTTKKRPSPPFMRLRTYITNPLPIGYTVQSDLFSGQRETKRMSYLPDMGLINARYRFVMQGANKKRGKKTWLRIESWSPMPRLRRDVDFDWAPDTWYRVKFEVKPAGDKALCRAKVWPRGTPEPSDWTIAVEDPYPNHEGSAGIYCYSTGTTSGHDGPATYFDNVKVYRDE